MLVSAINYVESISPGVCRNISFLALVNYWFIRQKNIVLVAFTQAQVMMIHTHHSVRISQFWQDFQGGYVSLYIIYSCSRCRYLLCCMLGYWMWFIYSLHQKLVIIFSVAASVIWAELVTTSHGFHLPSRICSLKWPSCLKKRCIVV